MFLVKNVTAGSIPIRHETGAVTVPSGKTLDLERYCSKAFIDTNSDIQTLIGKKALIVLSVVAQPKTEAPKPPPPKEQPKRPRPAPPTAKPKAPEPPAAKPAPKQAAKSTKRIRVEQEKSPWE